MVNKNISKDNKQSSAIWGGRFDGKPSKIMENINASISFDKRLYKEDIFASIAHTKMLKKQKILSEEDASKIINGLNQIQKEIESNKFAFSVELEDIHMNIEARLKNIIGETAGKLHTARSRNDQVATDLRLWTRNSIVTINHCLKALQKALIDLAEKNYNTIMPGFTHLQVAQPVTFGHYLLAYVEMFGRDRTRYFDCSNRLNENPLGSAALAGTAFPIDRTFTTKELDFSSTSSNSIDSVSDRDFALDFLSSASICALHISRFAEEIIIWNSDIFKLITINDKMLTGSSIMPQKKNPDPAELIRGRAGKNFGALQAMLTTMKGLPLSYYKDMQEDKSLVFESFDILLESIIITNELVKNLKPNKDRMNSLSREGYTTATDFADYLVQNNNLSFREAYKISAKLVNYAEKNNKKLDELSFVEVKKLKNNLNKDVMKVFNVRNSVNLKTSYGGTSTKNIKKMISKLKKEFK